MSSKTPRQAAAVIVIAILGVLLVSAGSATAARLITGKDIQNGSISGKDIKNKSVAAKDLSRSAKKSLTGPAGPAGPAGTPGGPAGPAGPTGPAGPAVLTNVYAASLPLEGLIEDTPEVVLSKILPLGKPYLFTAKLTLSTVGVGTHSCELRSGPDVIDTATVKTTTTFSLTPITMTGVTASSGLARISCTVDGGFGAAQQTKLVAIPVASIG